MGKEGGTCCVGFATLEKVTRRDLTEQTSEGSQQKNGGDFASYFMKKMKARIRAFQTEGTASIEVLRS